MNLLLDTQVFLWLRMSRARISNSTLAMLVASDARLHVSLVSCWEIAIKAGLGKLYLPESATEYVPRSLHENRLQLLEIGLDDVLHVGTLGHHHGDPFDRLIIAQALRRDLRVVTSDMRFAAYGVRVLEP